MAKFIIFLRGVTPTGKNKVPMAPLRSLLEKAGFKNVQTWIQSGNVILDSPKSHSVIEAQIEAIIKKNFGGDIPCVAKTPAQIKSILKKCPFKEDGEIYFTMLKSAPAKTHRMDFQNADYSPDKVVLAKDVIYSKYKTRVSDSKYNNNYFERKLQVRCTSRNQNTMNNMLRLAATKKTD